MTDTLTRVQVETFLEFAEAGNKRKDEYKFSWTDCDNFIALCRLALKSFDQPAPPSADAVLSLMPEIEHMLLRIRNVCAEQGFNEMLIDVRNLQERTLKATGKWRKLGMKE